MVRVVFEPAFRALHDKQRRLWEQEHKNPIMFPFLSSTEPAESIVFFERWLRHHGCVPSDTRGLEMCCGKGRNVIWLAQQGFNMAGFDFSSHAINEATYRAASMAQINVHFATHDAALPWPYDESSFDFAIDCFGTTELESPELRNFAREEIFRVLKPGSFLFIAAVSADSGFHEKLARTSPGPFLNTVIFPSGKIETVMSAEDLRGFYSHGEILYLKSHMMKELIICGEKSDCLVHWLIVQKPKGRAEVED